jgi:hypothetical protein
MQIGRRRGSAGQHEGFQRLKLRIHRIDFPFQPLDLGIDDTQGRIRRVFLLRRAQVGAQIEQVVLNAHQHRIGHGIAGGVQSGDADHRVGLVDGAIGGDAGIVLGHAPAVAQRGLPLVATTGIDARQLDHDGQPAPVIRASANISRAMP